MEIEEIDNTIAEINRKIARLQRERLKLYEQKQLLLSKEANADVITEQVKSYELENFPWSQSIKELALEHWDIREFRPPQLPIINAALDLKSDLFVVLPTGAGKSLTYQLPALFEKDKGFTLVVSPLISLIQDQVFHLREAKVCATYITSTTSQQETKTIHNCMIQDNNLRLIYVTPEKIAKSKRFMSILNKAYDLGRLVRIVIDEAHCCSQQGHDFRPDYMKLNVLRTVFPRTPIMALTATCPMKIMKDVMSILGLRHPHMPKGTLVYSAPLHRPNLIYQVIQKPETHPEIMNHMKSWILEHHPKSSGIVYCTTKKEVESVCADLSRYGIRSAVYHADIHEDDKELVHRMWRNNEISVIVATVAFGMGINHLNTRFIIHHSISKSLENYYQETGRAGRDGKDADCVLYYRGQDGKYPKCVYIKHISYTDILVQTASRMSSMVVGEVNGGANLYSMIKYAQSLTECRKVLFEKYFDFDPSISVSVNKDHVVNQITPNIPCGRCDNGGRGDNFVTVDITVEALTLVTLCKTLTERAQRVTMQKLIQLWQGKAMAAHSVSDLKTDPTIQLPVSKKFKLKDLERIVNHLLIENFLAESYHFTVYSNISYIVEGARSDEFDGVTKDDIEEGKCPVKIEFDFEECDADFKAQPKRRKMTKKATTPESSDPIWID